MTVTTWTWYVVALSEGYRDRDLHKVEEDILGASDGLLARAALVSNEAAGVVLIATDVRSRVQAINALLPFGRVSWTENVAAADELFENTVKSRTNDACTCGPLGYTGYDKCRQLGCDPECPVC